MRLNAPSRVLEEVRILRFVDCITWNTGSRSCVVQFAEGLLQAETGNEEFWAPSVDADPPADREAGHGFKAQVLCLAAGHFPV